MRRISFHSKAINSIGPENCHKFNMKIALPYIRKKGLLDIGSGNGNFLSLIESVCCAVGIDIKEDGLKVAKTSLLRTKFVLASATELPFKDSTFGVITMWDVIEHIPKGNECNVFSEINRVLEKDGKLCLSTMNDRLIGKILDPAYFLCGHRHYAEEKIIEWLNSSKFAVDKIFHSTGIFSMLSGNIDLFFKHILGRKAPKINVLERRKETEFQHNVQDVKKPLFRIHVVATKRGDR